MIRAAGLALILALVPAAWAQDAVIDPATGLYFDPATGYNIDPLTGFAYDPNSNQRVDPATGLPIEVTAVPPAHDPAEGIGTTVTTENVDEVSEGTGGVLRVLDKISGDLMDLTLKPGESQTVGKIAVAMSDCRFPTANPAGNAYAYVTINREGQATAAFAGWMVASSPALDALDDPRYDVWVLRCTTS